MSLASDMLRILFQNRHAAQPRHVLDDDHSSSGATPNAGEVHGPVAVHNLISWALGFCSGAQNHTWARTAARGRLADCFDGVEWGVFNPSFVTSCEARMGKQTYGVHFLSWKSS